MKKSLLCLLISISICLADVAYSWPFGGRGISGGGSGVVTAPDCSTYTSIGQLCQDTDDGKLYKGTGSGVSEIAAGSSGDVVGPATNTAGGVPLWGSADSKTLVAGVAKGSNNTFFGVNNSGTLGFHSQMQMSNSAAQVYDSEDATKLVLIDPSGNSTGVTATIKTALTTSATINLPANPIGGTLGATTNVIPKASGTGTATLQASGITEDGSKVDLGSLNFVTTGTVSGKIPVVVNSDTASYNITQAQARANTFFLSTNAATTTYTLPSAEAGMAVCIKQGQGNAQILRVDSDGTDYIVKETGARTTTAGDYYGASANAKNQICLAAFDTTDWYVTSVVGSWTEE